MSDVAGFEPDPFDPGPADGPLAGQPLTDGGVVEIVDTTGDGVADLVIERLADGSVVAVADGNGDLRADVMGIDLDGDGQAEMIVSLTDLGYHVAADVDGDGVFETETAMTREQVLAVDPLVVEALDMRFGSGADPGAQDPTQVSPGGLDVDPQDVEPQDVGLDLVADGQLIGDPAGDAEHWFQQSVNGFCVPASVAQIVSEYTGEHHADEQHFVERANELKVFEVGPDGVPGVGVEGALALLEDAGIPASIELGTGVETLVEYLDEGRRVVLAIDSGEIWTGETTEDNAPDHAIVVTGVDVARGVVIVSDPGDPTGNGKEYPIDAFEDAWADSGYAAVVCDVTPEEFRAGAGGVAAETGAEVVSVAAGSGSGTAGAAQDLDGTLDRGLEDGLALDRPDDESPVDAAVHWAVQNPWVVIPVLLGARAVLGSRR